jgi:hypothetical protein
VGTATARQQKENSKSVRERMGLTLLAGMIGSVAQFWPAARLICATFGLFAMIQKTEIQ